jgi:hypothetical protein
MLSKISPHNADTRAVRVSRSHCGDEPDNTLACGLVRTVVGYRRTAAETLGDKLETVGDGRGRSETLRSNLVSSRVGKT